MQPGQEEQHVSAESPNLSSVHDSSSDYELPKHVGEYDNREGISAYNSDAKRCENSSPKHSPSRPNKYSGPPSTWRNQTASERELAASLDQIQAKDLAVHLYNAFALRQRAKKSKGRFRGQGKAPSLSDYDNTSISLGEQEWTPPNVWTAWPLLPDVVPKEVGVFHQQNVTFLEPSVAFSRNFGQSWLVQDLLVAQVLKSAKQSFWDWKHKEKIQPSSPTCSPTSMSSRRDSHRENTERKGISLQLLDDEESTSDMIKPTINHVLMKLDELLMGLHHARLASLVTDDTKGRSKSREEGRNESISRSKTRPLKRSKKRPEIGASFSSRSESSSPPIPTYQKPRSSTRKTQHFRKEKNPLGLRDWGDVLGVASMTNWDLHVVQKAAARCGTLLNESITFRTLEENGDVLDKILTLPNAQSINAVCQLPAGDQKLDRAIHSVPDPRRLEKRMEKVLCPVFGCNRSSHEFRSFSRLNRHMKQVHHGLGEPGQLIRRGEEMFGGVHIDGFLQPIVPLETWKTKAGPRQRRGGNPC